jgi:hypothetical protein
MAQINNAATFLYNKLFADAVSEIKSNLKPTFNRPYYGSMYKMHSKSEGFTIQEQISLA